MQYNNLYIYKHNFINNYLIYNYYNNYKFFIFFEKIVGLKITKKFKKIYYLYFVKEKKNYSYLNARLKYWIDKEVKYNFFLSKKNEQ
jgi:hypothetical protein